ncbi:transcription and mRNA export factor ENY2-like [Tripterygium wilfordii]|uniref:transcription and mRNA export factor ENY2-like n=1 Tax=Tripterygium wilfordii TaxID=458696 RepID=UPI0018F80396|nr:transcription and mRNA export factor ENY2-like [Tripterygium wilfordii]
MVQTRTMTIRAESSAAEKDKNDIKDQEQERKPRSLKKKRGRKPKTEVNEAEKRELLKEMLRERLADCSWIDCLMDRCRALINEKGIHDLTLDILVDEITPLGIASVPGSVKEELSQKIEAFIASKPSGGST